MKAKLCYYLPYTAMTVAILLPSLAVLWLLQRGMAHELQVIEREYKEKALIQTQVLKHDALAWKRHLESLRYMGIKELLKQSKADALLIYSGSHQALLEYPRQVAIPHDSNRVEAELFRRPRFMEEDSRDFVMAAYEFSLENNHSDINLAARARQSQIRCLLKAQKTAEASVQIEGFLDRRTLMGALDSRGHAIVLNIKLLQLTLQKDENKLTAHLADFVNELRDGIFYAAPLEQIVFVKTELQRLFPKCDFPLLEAEKLALKLHDVEDVYKPGLQKVASQEMWYFRNMQGVVYFFKDQTFKGILAGFWQGSPTSLEGTLVKSSEKMNASWLQIKIFENWYLAVKNNQIELMREEQRRRLKIYYYSGAAIIAIVLTLLIVVIRLYRRHEVVAELKNEVLSNVAHELKTPLASTKLLLETLSLRKFSADKVEQYHQTMSRENERLSLLVENFLTFSSIEQNKFKVKISGVDCGSFLDEVNSAVKDRFSDDYSRLKIDNACPSACQFKGDSSALLHAVLNLVENAFKYSAEEVTLKLTSEHQQICFSVIDLGIGLDAVQQKKIFKRFHQVDRSLSSGTYGCGLGLSIVDGIIRAHGSKVIVESEKGSGSRFSFVLKEQMNEDMS